MNPFNNSAVPPRTHGQSFGYEMVPRSYLVYDSIYKIWTLMAKTSICNLLQRCNVISLGRHALCILNHTPGYIWWRLWFGRYTVTKRVYEH